MKQAPAASYSFTFICGRVYRFIYVESIYILETFRAVKAGSHDPIFRFGFFFLALFQFIEMLIHVSNFFESE